MPAAPQRVTVQRIDEEHGNPLACWQKMGEPIEMNRAEIEALKADSMVPEEELPFTYTDGVVQIQAALGVNDVWLIRIEA